MNDYMATTHQDLSATVELFEKLAPLATFTGYSPDNRFYLYVDGVSYCYLVRSGVCKVYHQSDEMLLGTLQVPGFIGISGMLSVETGLFIQTHSTSEIAIITTERARQCIAENNLWKLLARHTTRVISRLYTINTNLTAASAYEVIRVQLLELMNEPTEYKNNVSAAHYIRQKTGLSRSSIMKILAQLRKGNYIRIENGTLKEIYRLPHKY